MWKSRLTGLILAILGGGLFAFVLSEGNRAVEALFVYRWGLPVVLLLGMIGLIVLVFGVHLLIAPNTAARRWARPFQRKP
jgi:hypothetical protein